MRFILFLTLVGCTFYASAQENPAKNDKKETKVSRLGEYKGYSDPIYKGFEYSSFYHTTPDGVRLAIDVFLPKKIKPDDKFPAILYLTRYVRTLEGKGFVRWLRNPILGQIGDKEINFFTSRGYACIIVDARGSGASSSSREMDFSPKEIGDVNGVMDWVVAQSWSNGKIGTTGVSYVGTTAELIAANRHPAHKAAIPRSAIFDLYEDIAFPGGLRQGPFVDIWGQTTAALDKNEIGFVSKQAKKFVKGINPVQGDKKREELVRNIQDHKQNYEVHKHLLLVESRDELHPELKEPIDKYSVHSRISEIAASGVAIFRIGGYYDGALASSVIKGFLNTPNTTRVLLGPWDHGPRDYASPFAAYASKQFDVFSEMLRFFDYHLKGIDNGIQNEPVMNYFTMGSESWHTASSWPPVGIDTLRVSFLGDGLSLSSEVPVKYASYSRRYDIDYGFTTGGGARWNSLTPLFRGEDHTNYARWSEKTKTCLSFLSDTLEEDYRIAGEAEFTIRLASDTPDGAVFVFLEEVKPDGSVHYITEGQLRLAYRKVETAPLYKRNGASHSYKKQDAMPFPVGEAEQIKITALPISYYLPKGSRIRISVAGADVGHSDEVSEKPTYFDVFSEGSGVVIPVIKP